MTVITTATLTVAEAAGHLLMSIYKLIRHGPKAARIELDAAINAFASSHIIDNGIRAAALLLADVVFRSSVATLPAVACAGPAIGPMLGFMLYGIASGMAWQKAEQVIQHLRAPRAPIGRVPLCTVTVNPAPVSLDRSKVRWIWRPILGSATPAQCMVMLQPHDKTPHSLKCYICKHMV